jgi:hypothetical protein
MTFVGETSTLLVLATEGDLVVVSCDSPYTTNLIGAVEAGILAAAWSPDEEILMIVTGSSTLLAMSSCLEELGEVSCLVSGADARWPTYARLNLVSSRLRLRSQSWLAPTVRAWPGEVMVSGSL